MGHRKTYSSNLASLLKGICRVPSVLDTSVFGLAIDSRKVRKGDLFLAVSGSQSESTDHIKEAIENGANAVVAEGSSSAGKVFEDGNAIELFVENLKDQIGLIADRFFRSPSSDVSVVGVTGTNGKTSVTNYLANYFSHAEQVSGVIGTLGYGLVNRGSATLKETGFTTPNIVDVHKYLAELRDAGAATVFMEVSSHGLTQGRVNGVRFEGAVFTNLSREHLDYHGSMAGYAASKVMLFTTEHLKFVVVNQDDHYAQQFIDAVHKGVDVFTYGIESESDIRVLTYQLGADSASTITAEVSTSAGEFGIYSNLIGKFNLSNLLAVMAVAVAKQDLNACEQRIQAILPVDGRMEMLQLKHKPVVVVDFAHTPDALKNAIAAVKPHCQGNVIVVFGCGGDRDVGKRKEMAHIAETLADVIVVTDDNPRTESADIITDHIFEGFNAKRDITLEHNRELAIQHAISGAGEQDLVLIAGKGHESWQEINGKKYPFSDIDVARRALGLDVKTEKSREAFV